MQKTICIFTQSLLPGGAEKQAVILAETLQQKYKPIVITFYNSGKRTVLEKRLIDRNITIKRLVGAYPYKLYSLGRFFFQERPRIIFSFLLLPNIIAGIIGKITGVNYIIGGIRNAFLNQSKERLYRFTHNYLNDLTIYNNYRGYIHYSKRGFKKEKSVVITNCITNISKTHIRKNNKKIRILSVGRFVQQKDWISALEAIKDLKLIFKQIKYYIVGYGPNDYIIRKWITDNKSGDYMELFEEPDDIKQFYVKADVFLQTSLFEGVSNVVLEAMNNCLPLVTTDVGDNNKLVIDGYNGFLCKPKDVKRITSSIYELCISYNKRINYGLNSHSLLEQNHSHKIFKKAYLNLIDNLYEESRQP